MKLNRVQHAHGSSIRQIFPWKYWWPNKSQNVQPGFQMKTNRMTGGCDWLRLSWWPLPVRVNTRLMQPANQILPMSPPMSIKQKHSKPGGEKQWARWHYKTPQWPYECRLLWMRPQAVRHPGRREGSQSCRRASTQSLHRVPRAGQTCWESFFNRATFFELLFWKAKLIICLRFNYMERIKWEYITWLLFSPPPLLLNH